MTQHQFKNEKEKTNQLKSVNAKTFLLKVVENRLNQARIHASAGLKHSEDGLTIPALNIRIDKNVK